MSVSARRIADGPGGGPRFHYLVRWRDDQRIEHARMFATEGDAAAFDSGIKAGRAEPRSGRRGSSPTFGAEAMDWLATKQATKRARTAARYESHLRLHVLPAFGPRPVAAITRRDVQQWINMLARDNLSASTIGDIYRGVFKAVLNKAILDGRLAVSPCHRIELPQRAAGEVVPPTPEQVLAVIGALPVRYRAMAAIAAGPERGSPRPPGSQSAGCAVTRSGCASTGSCSRPGGVRVHPWAGVGTPGPAPAAARGGGRRNRPPGSATSRCPLWLRPP